jgi:tRNA pseudouridine55 synthase
MKPGIHLLHKPPGPTSFSLVQQCRTGVSDRPGHRARRICHGGTLDPFASGLLLILVEPATRLFDYLHAIPKVYEATVRWGVETDNGDPNGRVTMLGDSSGLEPARLDDALATFVGWHEQIPHPTSAKRVGGERAYLKAHRGEDVVMPASKVYLHEARWIDHNLPFESRLRVVVRGGYYIRALARDLGQTLGCGAHLSHLHRAAIGPWNDPGEGQTAEVHGKDLLPWAPVRLLSDHDVGDLRQDKTISADGVVPGDWPLPEGFPDPAAPVRGFHQGKFCFLLAAKEGGLGVVAGLAGGL